MPAHRADEMSAIVETDIGPVGIAWTRRGLTRVQLPERDQEATAARLAGLGGRCDAAAETGAGDDLAGKAVAALRAYALGEPVDFTALPLDLEGARAFDLPVWQACRAIGWGKTVTYGELTRRLGPPYVARAVGQALGRNPVPIVVPCHRVVAAGHRIGGFSAPGGAVTKERLLALEGVKLEAPAPLLDLIHKR